METERDRQFELRLDAGRPLPDVIADKIRELIEAGIYKPGGRLDNESELARNMKVARSSVRTALQRLETLRVLEVKRGLGWYVRRTPPSSSSTLPSLLAQGSYRISDLFELRIGLEGLAASLAAVRVTEGEVEDIAKYNVQHQEAGDDFDELLRTDEAFHEAIVRASRNELLIETYGRIVGEIRDWRHQSYSVRGVPLRSAREHSKIVRYLRNGDPGGARVAMNSHLQRLYDELSDIGDEPLDTTHSGPDSEPEWRQTNTDG
jgi:GntR family transcriptional regulator, transcriptional repressor for pyruvate dehydrogenase complex